MNEEEKETIVRRSISITKDMDDWLKQHPEVNSSAVFRQSIYELQAGEAVHVSMYSLGFFMLISFSFVFLLWIMIPKQLIGFVMLFLMSIILVILVKSVIYYNRYQEEMKKWKLEDMKIEGLLNEKKQ